HLLDILAEVADGQPARHRDFAVVRRLLADDHPEDGRLPRPVRPDETGPFLRVQLKGGVDEQHLFAVLLGDVDEGDHFGDRKATPNWVRLMTLPDRGSLSPAPGRASTLGWPYALAPRQIGDSCAPAAPCRRRCDRRCRGRRRSQGGRRRSSAARPADWTWTRGAESGTRIGTLSAPGRTIAHLPKHPIPRGTDAHSSPRAARPVSTEAPFTPLPHPEPLAGTAVAASHVLDVDPVRLRPDLRPERPAAALRMFVVARSVRLDLPDLRSLRRGAAVVVRLGRH